MYMGASVIYLTIGYAFYYTVNLKILIMLSKAWLYKYFFCLESALKQYCTLNKTLVCLSTLPFWWENSAIWTYESWDMWPEWIWKDFLHFESQEPRNKDIDWCWLICLWHILSTSIEQASGQCATVNNPQLVTPCVDVAPFCRSLISWAVQIQSCKEWLLSRISISVLSTSCLKSMPSSSLLLDAEGALWPWLGLMISEFLKWIGLCPSLLALNASLHFNVSLWKSTSESFHLCIFMC